MGLDVTYSSGIERAQDDEHDLDLDAAGTWLENDAAFTERGDGIAPGRYLLNGDEAGGFRAGSYSGYNDWRMALCQAIHGCDPRFVWDDPEPWAGRPFFELVQFTDCDGFIGPRTSAKLERDFLGYRETFRAAVEESWMLEVYDEFTAAFGAAARGGVVVFH
jgi:hypothetical protein